MLRTYLDLLALAYQATASRLAMCFLGDKARATTSHNDGQSSHWTFEVCMIDESNMSTWSDIERGN